MSMFLKCFIIENFSEIFFVKFFLWNFFLWKFKNSWNDSIGIICRIYSYSLYRDIRKSNPSNFTKSFVSTIVLYCGVVKRWIPMNKRSCYKAKLSDKICFFVGQMLCIMSFLGQYRWKILLIFNYIKGFKK